MIGAFLYDVYNAKTFVRVLSVGTQILHSRLAVASQLLLLVRARLFFERSEVPNAPESGSGC